VINPLEPVASGTDSCSVTVRDTVTDKVHDPVPPEMRGPYSFGIAQMRIVSTIPKDGVNGVAVQSDFEIAFNADVDPNSAVGSVTLSDGMNNVPVSFAILSTDADGEIPTALAIHPVADLKPGTVYTLTIAPTGVRDVKGGPLTLTAPRVIHFTTATPAP
jgi:hypothetical protein